jgi:hypothetical protein
MLTKDQRMLLDNVLESLNRLFDSASTVTDVHVLLVATAIALRGSELAVAFEEPIRQLNEVVRSKSLPDQRRDLGLDATDGLRGYVAAQLRQDKHENPKQRHTVLRAGTPQSGPTG